ncbi:MAG: PqqD family protein [Nitrospirae bacterium]|nr:PqqD family protein [Nitrospirota bacterium]
MEPMDLLDSDLWDRVFIRDKDVVARKIAGELFLVPVRGKLADMGNIFTLTAVGEFIWDRLEGQKSLNDVRNDVLEEFDVGREQAEADIREFITELLEAGLIREGTI